MIARRAAFELRAGDVVNLGVGVSADDPECAAEEGIEEQITLTVEAGVIGGVPGHGREFGSAVQSARHHRPAVPVRLLRRRRADIAFVSFAEVDAEGNVNVTRFGDRYDGAGGFIDISQNAHRLVFSGTLTGGKLNLGIEDGRLVIRKDGEFRKFVRRVGQISFNGQLARERGQQVVFISERAVFRLEQDGLVLCEIAPGADLQRDVLQKMEFAPRISTDLKEMDARIFREGRMGLQFREQAPTRRQVRGKT